MKKLISQIPCFNEEETQPAELADIPLWLVSYRIHSSSSIILDGMLAG